MWEIFTAGDDGGTSLQGLEGPISLSTLLTGLCNSAAPHWRNAEAALGRTNHLNLGGLGGKAHSGRRKYQAYADSKAGSCVVRVFGTEGSQERITVKS